MTTRKTIGEIRDSYKNYSDTDLLSIKESVKNELHRAKDSLEVAKTYERINHIIEGRFIENYGNEPHKFGGRYGNLYKRPDYDKWKGTFFDTERLFIEACLTPKVQSLSKIQDLIDGKSSISILDGFGMPIKACLMGYCDYAQKSKAGPILHLIEPDGEYTTPPFLGMENHMADIYAGKICLVHMKFQKGMVPEVKGVATLPFTLHERIKKNTPEWRNLTEPEMTFTQADWDDFMS